MAASPESVLWECFNDKWYPDFLQGSSLRVTILLQSYKYNLYTNIYVSIIYWYVYICIYINMYTCIARFPEQLHRHRRWVPIALWDFLQRWTATTSPSWADDGSQKWLARLSYNDWSLCSASVNQIQSLCLFSNKAWSGSAFTLKGLSVLLLQRSQFLSKMMTKGPKARSHRRSYDKYYQIQEVVQKETMFREKTTMFWKNAMLSYVAKL